MPLALFVNTCCYILANYLVDKLGGQSRPVVMIGAMVGLSLFYSCAIIKYQPVTFVIVWGSSLGIMKGFFLAASYKAAWSHLSKMKGAATGIISSGYGVGAAIFGLYF